MSRLAGRGPTGRSVGQSLVEFALVLPILLFLFMILFDFGRAVYAYSTVSDAARQGVRYAIVNQTTASIRSQAAGAATALGINAGDVQACFLLAGQASEDCPPPPADDCSPLDLGCVAQVKVEYTWTAITPIISSVLGPIDMSSMARMPIERVYP